MRMRGPRARRSAFVVAVALCGVAAADVSHRTDSAVAVEGDLTSSQGYLDPASAGGIDARFAWEQPGGRGDNVTVVGIEYATWNLDHEDLPPVQVFSHDVGGLPFDFSDDHGTQVLGIIGALDDGTGMTGIAPASGLAVIAHTTAGVTYLTGVEAAIRRATDELEPGDVVLVEANFDGGPSGEDTPIEWHEPIHDAIGDATDAGIIVVQTAGNGATALDLVVPQFDSYDDNGSIVVGAGHPPASGLPARSTVSYSNHGDRVDLQGWGESVATLGGSGDLAGSGSTPCNSTLSANRNEPTAPPCATDTYTSDFSGTSSAAPMVAAAAAALSSIAQEDGRVLCPHEVREILVHSGTPAPTNEELLIGPLPDLRAALGEYRQRYPFVESDGADVELVRIGKGASAGAQAIRLDVARSCGVLPL